MTSTKYDYANYALFDPSLDLCTKFKVISINENRVIGQRSWKIVYFAIW